MGKYLKMQLADKNNLCQNIYEEVSKCADYLEEYAKYAKLGKMDIPAACYTNFRDALFHFRKMACCSEEHEIMQQAFAIKEHLSRARTDAKTSVLFYYSYMAGLLLKDNSVKSPVKRQLRECLHQMKNVIMMCRINGMMLSETAVMKISEEEVTEILEKYFDLLKNDCFDQALNIICRGVYRNASSQYAYE